MAGRSGRWMLLAASVLAALAVLEGAARLRPGPGCAPRPVLWRPSRAVGWALVPGARGDVAVCAGERVVTRHAVAINANGQRDRARTYEPTAGTPRVLVLGDSFVEALHVDLESTFLGRLERRLGVEMLDAGVSGYATDNELRAFDATGARYRPDAVLLVFFVGNDVQENGARTFMLNPHGLPPKPWLAAPEPSGPLAACLLAHRSLARVAGATPDLLWLHSHVVRGALGFGLPALLGAACAGTAGPALVPGVPELIGVYREPATRPWEEAWAETERLLGELAARVAAAGMRFGVAIAPHAAEYDPRLRWQLGTSPEVRRQEWDYAYPHRRLEAFFTAEHIPWVSLLPPLRAHLQATGRPGCYPSDGHWDDEGHEVVAAALEPFVQALLR